MMPMVYDFNSCLSWVLAAIVALLPPIRESLAVSVEHSAYRTGWFLSFLTRIVFHQYKRPHADDAFMMAQRWPPCRFLQIFAESAPTAAAKASLYILENGSNVLQQMHDLFDGMTGSSLQQCGQDNHFPF